jgi:thioredoxin reductase
MLFDIIVIGGSYAGMAAAVQIARARRNVLIIDAGLRRNRFAEASHGFLGQDGRSPAAIVADARAQLMTYPSVTWIDAAAKLARKTDLGFSIQIEEGRIFDAKRLVLATGVTDELPDVPGLKERWGKSVFHCPYCHGYELNNGRLGVLATDPFSIHQAMMVPDWGRTTFFINGAFEIEAEQAERLIARGVTIESELVAEVTGDRADIKLQDGRTIALDGLFALPRTRVTSPLAEQLGCVFESGPLGPFIQTGATKETTVEGVFACGDVARSAGSISLAVGDGATAGAAAHQSLIFQ